MTINTTGCPSQSQEIGKLLEALGKAQNEMEGAIEDSANPYFKSKYADLTSIWRACRQPLTKNGLSVIQTMQIIDGQLCLVSVLGHTSGEFIRSFLPVKPAKEDIQALGSAITYCRRYALAALVGVCPADDDGESAMDRNKKTKEEKPVVLRLPEGENAALAAAFVKASATEKFSENAIREHANANMEKFLERFHQWIAKNEEKQQQYA